jgi:hypothetical protein
MLEENCVFIKMVHMLLSIIIVENERRGLHCYSKTFPNVDRSAICMLKCICVGYILLLVTLHAENTMVSYN